MKLRKKIVLGAFGVLALSSSAVFAQTLEVKGWSGCTQFIDPFHGLTSYVSCQQRGVFTADTCDAAYQMLEDTQKCCEWQGALFNQFHKSSCEVSK
jgi:hypothetical protein